MGQIYGIKHLLSGKIYIGSTTKPKSRKKQHFSDLRKNRHCNKHLQRAFNKYGEGAFQWLVIETTTEDLAFREKYWIDYFYSDDGIHGYNGTNQPYAPMRGKTFSEKTIAMFKDGRRKGSKHPNAKIDENVVKSIFSLREKGLTQKEIGLQLSIHNSNVSLILNGKAWNHVKGVNCGI